MERPLFLYVVGIEGCGHHALVPMLFRASGARPDDRRQLRRCFDERWTRAANETVEHVHALDRKIVEAAKGAAATGRMIIEGNSFPSGGGRRREPTGHWNLLEMRGLLRTHFDTRYLVLHRDPIEATFSHADWDGGLVGHARNIACYLEHLDVFLRRLDPGEFRVLRYHDLLFEQDRTAPALGAFLGLPTDRLRDAMRAHLNADPERVGRWKTQLDQSHRDWITSFFELHAPSWATFTDPARDLLGDG